MADEQVLIEENGKINERYYRLAFRSKALSQKVEPGHFLQVLIHPGLDPFLRRPFSYYRVQGERVEIMYEVLGRGTAMLSQYQKGDRLKVMGPLGRPFTQNIKNKKTVLVAGGVGVPPLVFLAEKKSADYLLIGTKSKAEVLPPEEIAHLKTKVLHATNDGSYGQKGFVTLLLEDIIKKEGAANLYIQTCGPTPMMQAVMDMAKRCGVEGEASVEKPMACGVGACLGCMVKTHQGWKPSCVEGPVFKFEELVEV